MGVCRATTWDQADGDLAAAPRTSARPAKARSRPAQRRWRAGERAGRRLWHGRCSARADAAITMPVPIPAGLCPAAGPQTRPGRDQGRWTVLWMMGLVVLVVSAVVALLWYLNHFEPRKKSAAGAPTPSGWSKACSSTSPPGGRPPGPGAAGGLDGPQAPRAAWPWQRRRRGGGCCARRCGGWPCLDATQATPGQAVRAAAETTRQHDANPQACPRCRTLPRPAPLATPAPCAAEDSSTTDRVWLAVPYFDGSLLMGMYVAALSLQKAAVDALLPPWFLRSQTVRLVVDAVDTRPTRRRAPTAR